MKVTPGTTVTDCAALAVPAAESARLTVNGKGPATVGVPEIVLEDRVSPPGSAPEPIDQV
jgi:hypothetical protein